MISFLKGKIKFKTDDFLVLENQGIGYKVFVGSVLLSEKKVAEELELYTYLKVREDDLSLYGFVNFNELQMFEKLISVSGVGPKSASQILSVAKIEDLQTAILEQRPEFLTQFSGIGKKTAERIVLELKNKLKGLAILENTSTVKNLTANQEVVEALVGLGYSVQQAQEAVKYLPQDIEDISQKIKLALKGLSR